jgi:hypothetical protein
MSTKYKFRNPDGCSPSLGLCPHEPGRRTSKQKIETGKWITKGFETEVLK